jgi:glucose/arabinose dehydrogenase
MIRSPEISRSHVYCLPVPTFEMDLAFGPDARVAVADHVRRVGKESTVLRGLQCYAIFALLLALAACGGGSGTGSATAPENRVDVAVAGLPVGVDAAITITDPSGKAVSSLATAGQVVVSGPGTFNVAADPIVVGTATYVATVVPAAINVPAPPSISLVTVTYTLAPPLKLQFQPVASGLVSPTFLASPPGGTDIYIVEQPGRIRKLVNGVPQTPVLDISARVSSGGERGMLSLAFDPGFATNGNVFVYFTDTNGDIAIERFTIPVTGGVEPPSGSEATAVRVLTISHRTFANHNGGQLQFGLDGMLYLGTGDGGGAGDPFGNGQNLDTLLGKILRIDVRSLPYKVPPDNPFVDQPGKRPEIWAFGVRNPWRFSFDSTTRSLYIADVGEGSREEVDVVAASAAGLDYGWNIWEGAICYPSGTSCNPAGITMPLIDYDHGDGCSITGGYVYRGSALPEITGRYFYSDFCSGWLRSFLVTGAAAIERTDWGVTPVGSIQSFGVDSRKELYVLTSTGGVYKLVRQ